MNELFFELIRVVIGKQKCLSRTPKAEEWQALYDMAEMQALVGVCFAGVKKLERHQQMPLQQLYFQWLAVAAQIQERNEVMNRNSVEAQQMLSKAGFKACVLKGQGIAQLYGEELVRLRQSGDIDLWVNGGMEKALAWARENYGDVEFDYINAHLPMFKETEVELHWRVQSMANLFKNRKLQRWVAEHEAELVSTSVALPDGVGEINVPTLEFNSFYILLHCYHHMFESGLGLRQIMDFYFVCASLDGDGELVDENLLRRFGMLKFARAMMWVLGYVFGLERKQMLCDPNEQEGRFILQEVMQNGNFGHHDKRVKPMGGHHSKIGFALNSVQHNWHLATHYPWEFLWQPIWLAWHYAWKRTKKLTK